jgi:hypothetical protein
MDLPLTRAAREALAAAEKLAGRGQVEPAHLPAGLAGFTPAPGQYGITPERITSIFP